ncbi:hypothetical protein E1262_09095 [Jiangella aurantiaca]|uniref:Uncharacterized protein n=1 Tax=Jiangella aurantiaca TaxID=2530373 RepID=A0A4R5AFM4_9ACTN|nr:hypothetical protein [Jiangella aurantiaca]TDD70395.1 hypothetical protein E1262_09095 [Jiangella aurantiaca]
MEKVTTRPMPKATFAMINGDLAPPCGRSTRVVTVVSPMTGPGRQRRRQFVVAPMTPTSSISAAANTAIGTVFVRAGIVADTDAPRRKRHLLL